MHPQAQQNKALGRGKLQSGYAVYILRCETHDAQFINEYAKGRVDKCPEWASEAAEYEHVYYIGSTGNLFERIGQHFRGTGADFTSIFEPQKVEQLEFFRMEDYARAMEKTLPVEYRTYQRRYCYSDLKQFGNADGAKTEDSWATICEIIESSGRVSKENLLAVAKNRGVNSREAEEVIEALLARGEIYEPETGIYRAV